MFNLCIVMWMESSPIRIRKLGILVLMVMTSLGHASIVFFDYFIMVRKNMSCYSAIVLFTLHIPLA